VEEAAGETTIVIVGDNRDICKKDFVPDPKVMECLFERLLDCHPKFQLPIENGVRASKNPKQYDKVPCIVAMVPKNALL